MPQRYHPYRRVSNAYRVGSFVHNVYRAYRRAGPLGGLGAVAGAALSNYFAEVPELDTSPMLITGRKRGRGSVHRKMGPPEKKVVNDASGYIQLTDLGRAKVGRRIRRQHKLNKHVEAQLLTRIDRWQNMSTIASENGKFYLSALQNTATQKYALPFYLFDLTSLESNTWADNGFAGGTIYQTKSLPFSRLFRTATTYTHEQQSCVLNDGVTTGNGWIPERAPYVHGNLNGTANAPYEKAYLDWADIRIGIWGAKQNPSTVEILLCRFPWENRHPSANEYQGTVPPATLDLYPPPAPPASVNGSGAADYAEYMKFWTAQIDRLVGNPLSVRENGADQKGMSIVYRKVVKLNPTANFENDTTGHQYVFKLFHRMNMLCNYKNASIKQISGDGYTALTDISDPNVWIQDCGVQECHSYLRNKKSRLFLCIRGFCAKTLMTTGGVAPTDDPNVHASFDLMVRRKMTII